jgi:hypothetical protein
VTTNDKCRIVLERLVALCNTGKTNKEGLSIGFGPDWAGNSLTVFYPATHTHIGQPGGSFNDLVDSLMRILPAPTDDTESSP